MEGLLRGAFDIILELPQLFRGLLSQSSILDDSMLEDGLLANGSFGHYSQDSQTRSSKRPRLDTDAEDWEDRHGGHGGHGGDEARRSEQTKLHGHCKNCGVQIGSQDSNVSVGVQTDFDNSDLVPVTRNDNQIFDQTEETVIGYRIPEPSSSSEMGEVETFPHPDDQESYNPPLDQVQEKYEPYAEDAHIVLNSDGINQQLAILLTEDMASQIRRALDQHEQLLKEIEHKVLSAKSQVCGTEVLLQSVDDDAERTRLQQEANQYEEAVRRAEQRQNTLDQETSILRLNGLYRRDRLQHQLENILAESGLLDLASLKPPAIEHQAQDTQANHGPTSSSRSESVESATDPKELLRCAAREEMEEAFEAFQKADNNLDY